MKKIPKREEYVYMDCSTRMSKNKMADILYACIITHASIITTHGVGIYEYTREQNSYNQVDIKIHIHPDSIHEFEELSGVKLRKPIRITIN